MRRRGLLLTALAVSLALAAPKAAAQGSPADKTAADDLFREGRSLMKAGKAAEACGKFAESDRLDPQLGTHLNLAVCHETVGKTASAWIEFGEVLDRAQPSGQDAAFARKHKNDLENKLSRLRLRIATASAGMTLKVDGHEVGQAAWSQPLPLDPGAHTLEATAPGKKPWSQQVDIAAGPSTQELAVPALEDAAQGSPAAATSVGPSSSAPPPSPEPARGGSSGGGSGKTIGFVLAGVGVAGVAVGSVFGLMWFSQNSKANDNCQLAGGKCTPVGVDAGNAASTDALVSTIAFGAGLVALGVGTYFILSSKPAAAPAARLRVQPTVATSGGGLQLTGNW